MRKLASVRIIDSIAPIEGADAIETAMIGGWPVVVKKGEFAAGDFVIYFEVDSWVPHNLAPFLSRGLPPKNYNGVDGQRLRTIKLRGQVSQGLILPMTILYTWDPEEGKWERTGLDDTTMKVIEDTSEYVEMEITVATYWAEEGDDLTELLEIQKWEPAIAANLAGRVKGNFPSFIIKTDQERVQNLSKTYDRLPGEDWEVTEKLDGSSMTVYLKEGVFGVCSRNLELTEDPEWPNSFWQVARKAEIERRMREEGFDDIALQGELIGPGIQGNRYGLREPVFKVFSVFDIRDYTYLGPLTAQHYTARLGLEYVPVLSITTLPATISDLISLADGKSVLKPDVDREGLVCKHASGYSFKAISNNFLLKEK